MSSHLEELCLGHLKAAQGFYGGDVYRCIGLRGRRYEGLHLVWDAPSRIVVLAFCWDADMLRQTRDDLLHFHVTLPQLQVYKKLHLVLCHAVTENAGEQPWPAGLSFSPIALDPAVHVAAPPDFVAAKLDSILGIPLGAIATDEAAVTGERPPNWRLFLQDDRDIVLRKIRELAGEKAELPDDLQAMVDELLTLAEADTPDLREKVADALNRRWEVSTDASAGSGA